MKLKPDIETQDCTFLDCDKKIKKGWRFCDYHRNGGAFGNGETYEQYQIIEQDFIDFIKIVPIDDEKHLTVHSPVLRDIIIRCCVQIEVFFKEWGKQVCSIDKENSLWKKYNKNNNKKERNWNFGDYYYFKGSRGYFNYNYPVYVAPLNTTIQPFKEWEGENPKDYPEWWKAYNSIKHNGLNAKKEASLSNALYSLAALFSMHCTNLYSRGYLKKYSINTLKNKSKECIEIEFGNISSPIDSKRYLFKDELGFTNRVEIPTLWKLNNPRSKLHG